MDHPLYCLGCWSNTSDVADSTIMRKWKWLFVSGCGCKSLNYTVMEFLRSCRHGTNA